MDFTQYWQATDFLTKSLFFILTALSIATWVVGILRLMQSRKLAKTVAQQLTDTIRGEQLQLANLPIEQQKTVTEQHLLQQINRYRFDSEKGLSVLGTTAAIAPFIGLFGTVWGIFHALHRIGETGQAGLGQVAAPVGEALIMTGLGLAVAIPAVILYNLAVRCNRNTLHIANDTAHGLLAEVLTRQNSNSKPTSNPTSH